MKRHLKNDKYQMTDLERENLWHGIRGDLKAAGASPTDPARSSFKPAFGVAAAVALVVVVGSWWIGAGRLNQDGLMGGSSDVAMQQDPAPASRSIDLIEAGRVDLDKGTTDGLPNEGLDRTYDLSEAPKAPAAAPAMKMAAETVVEDDGTMTLIGRLRDAETGEPLEHASVMIRGTTLAAVADSNGAFTIAGLEPGTEVTLQVMMLGYDKVDQLLVVPDGGSFEVALDMKPIVVATLQEFDVEGAEYMVEVKSAVTEHTVSPDQALKKAAGVGKSDAELHVRGGRSGEPGMQLLSAAPNAYSEPARLMGGSVTGGPKNPNGEAYELMYFEHTGVNPFVATEDDSLSTFALDVDNASWTMARNYLERGLLPPKDAIRVEEFVNAFDPGWPTHTDEAFRIHADAGASRFGDGYHLLRIGLVGKTVDDADRKPANLVFVIDVSGSMGGENRLGSVRKALHVLLGELREGDTVGIVVYGSRGEVRLEPTDVTQTGKITAVIDGIVPNGSTNVYEGLALAYRMARDNFDAGKLNRLILCSDGVANNGMSTKAEEILEMVRNESDEGITISAIGFGMGNYNDIMMEKLANQGDGNYYYVDKHEEAERVFKENLTGLLQTIAREVKVQVAFEPDQVDRWRLLGYENRDVADRDFRNDDVDAGEVGAGHQVTALYELKLKDDADRGAIGKVMLRHEAPAHDTERAGIVEEIDAPLTLDMFEGDFGSDSAWRRAQTLAAEFAEILRESYWAKESDLADLIPLADQLVKDLPGDPMVEDLAAMIRQASVLKAADLKAAEED